LFDYLIIGAGPAGMFFADTLLQLNADVRIGIIDKGVRLNKRICPLVKIGKCKQCKVCLAVYGSGGAGMYSDGKLSSYPAGSGLADHLGDKKLVINLNQGVLNVIAAKVNHFDDSILKQEVNSSSLLTKNLMNSGFCLKSYNVVHLGSEGAQEFSSNIEKDLIKKGVIFFWKHNVKKISRRNEQFSVNCVSYHSENEYMSTRNIVLATGKASGTLIRKHFANLGVKYENNAIELGVRVEVKRSAIEPLYKYHLDAKIKGAGPYESEVRTFCVCSGGYLVSCYYDGFLQNKRVCTISGFSNKFTKSENSNFGLLVRRKFPQALDPIETQLRIVRAINEASGHGGTVVQRYEDFIMGRPTSHIKLKQNSVKTTLPSSSPVDLNWLLPSYVVKNIQRGMEKLSEIAPHISGPDTLLHAPVWELINDRPDLNHGFESTVPGCFIIGDATGIARGIIQAASTGVWAAQYAYSKKSH
jgi:uncharacterized FAD-dependent dehydrogenase